MARLVWYALAAFAALHVIVHHRRFAAGLLYLFDESFRALLEAKSGADPVATGETVSHVLRRAE